MASPPSKPKLSLRKLSGMVSSQLKVTKAAKQTIEVPKRRASVAQEEWLATRNEEQFVASTQHLSLRERATLRPLKKVGWHKVQPQWYGEIFSLYSSLGNEDCFSIGPTFKSGQYRKPDDRLLRHHEREVARTMADKRANEAVVPHDLLTHDDSDGKVRTQWNGTRSRSDEQLRCKGKVFPCDRIPARPRKTVHNLKPVRRPPLNGASYPSASIPDGDCDPSQYGTLRLACSPTANSIRALRNKYEDEKFKQRRARANQGRLMFADMNLAFVADH